MLRLLFAGILLAIVGAFGWWFWRSVITGHVTRDESPAWSRDGTQIIFSADVDGKSDLFVMDLQGRSRQSLTTTPAANEGHPSYSIDSKQVAFDSDRDGNYEIYVMQADGTATRRLTDHPGQDMAPAWSPDGRRLVFMSTRDNPDFDVYQMDADGGNVERLTTGGFSKFPKYSPDGSQIALQVQRDIYVLVLKTRTLRRVTHEPLNGMHPTWASDGRQLAFMTWRNGRTEIFTAKSSGSEQQLLVSMPRGDAIDPRWSPNGELVAFVNVPSGGVAEAKDAEKARIIYVVDVKTRRLTRLSR